MFFIFCRQTRTTKKPKNNGADFAEEADKEKEKAEKEEKPKYKSTRKFYHEDEDFYVMDAKSIGNIGRYLNHSCAPNCFVQNCFVDTHDLRFPWVSFFAMSHITGKKHPLIKYMAPIFFAFSFFAKNEEFAAIFREK